LFVICFLSFVISPTQGAERDTDIRFPVADFSLTERNGETVSRDDLLGKVWIASFVLVRCPDGKCPQVTQTMRRLQDDLAGRRDVVLVTFTVDPDRDTPDELNRYADAHGADPQRWLFLTGSEETIDTLMRSFYYRAGPPKKGDLSHSQRLAVIDRQGQIRGYYDGLRSVEDQGEFEADLRKLRRQVNVLLAPELPGFLPRDFPAFNATLNAMSAGLILLGYWAIRRRLIRLHIACMLTAILVSAVFLTSYLFYHIVIKQGRPTRFSEQAPGAPAWVGYLYLAILGSHTLLAIPAAPMALYTAYQGLRQRIAAHVRLARWTLPVWLYVSTTGVVVYWMLYRLYPLP
jgi:protein SCO1/2/putative membrane protein